MLCAPYQEHIGGLFCEGTIKLNNIRMENNISTLAGSSICSNGSTAQVTLENVFIDPPTLAVPVISVDNNSKVEMLESCTIQE